MLANEPEIPNYRISFIPPSVSSETYSSSFETSPTLFLEKETSSSYLQDAQPRTPLSISSPSLAAYPLSTNQTTEAMIARIRILEDVVIALQEVVTRSNDTANECAGNAEWTVRTTVIKPRGRRRRIRNTSLVQRRRLRR